jgi:RHS repeat-associated protein
MSRSQGIIMSLFRHTVAASLIAMHLVIGAQLWAHESSSAPTLEPQDPPVVSVNRMVPIVSAPPARPVFSAVPTDAEILRARVLPEPLVPVGASSPEENVALGAAILASLDTRQSNTLGALGRFMEAHPTSVWQPSLLVNAGLVLQQQGFFTRAAQDYRAAWNLARHVETRAAQAVADRAIGELLILESRLGHADVVEALLEEIADRPLTGAATEHLANAKQALWVMRNAPAEAFRCGPYALAQMIRAATAAPSVNAKLLMTRTGPDGISLARLAELARTSGMPSIAVMREGDAPFGIPSVVHLKAGHFTAVVRHEGDRYLLRDATLSREMWVTATALAEEASGAALVPEGRMPSGWRVMTDTEAGAVWGRGFATEPDPTGPNPPDPRTPPCDCGGGGGGRGMASYRAHLMQVSLNVFDTPVGYTPAMGPAVMFTLAYNQRESHQPQTFSYTNLGAKWTMDWLSYVTDDPANPNAGVTVFYRGGGEEPHAGFDSGTGRFAMNAREHTVLTRTSSSPIRYERLLPDGSKEVFAQADGASAYPRRVFMTQSIDPHGNALTFTYDAQLRLVAVTDALGQVTTLAYELPQDIWKITKVTDPFGRSATLTYDGRGRLERITDVIDLWSSFGYAADGFLTSLSTPYGTSRFTKSDAGFDRVLEMTDPMGGKERLEYRANDLSMPPEDPANTVPTVSGYTISNGFLQYRNTLYWDRKAMAVGAGDRTKAHLYHWLHLKDNVNQTVAILESEKAPLGNRIWYLYPNQASSVWEGDGRAPGVTARVLDDGTTQRYKAEYNQQGQVTKRIDPVGRETMFEYATNGIDLLTVKQKNGTGYDLLETRTWTADHEPLSVTDASGETTTYTYTASGQVETVTNARNETTTYAYNTSDQLTSVTGPISGATTTFSYDSYGRMRMTTDSDSYTVTTDYDAFDRPIQVTYPDGTTEQTQYRFLDAARRKDRMGRWTTFTFDAMRRQTSVRDPLGRVVQQDWCTCGSLNALIDANGNRTSWDRDVQGRLTKETRANGSFTTYLYEATTSRLKKVTDPKLQDTNYTYFADDKLQQTTYTNAAIATPSVAFTYDGVYSRVATMVDGTGTTSYAYHPVGTSPALGALRLATVDGPLTNDTISYEYDELGRVTERAINGAANTVTWTFDALGRTTSETNALGIFIYTYDGPTRRVATVTYPNSQTSTYGYFGNSGDRRLQTIHHKYPNGNTLSKFDYTYGVTGNILTWRQQADNNAVLWTYGYDAADQLTSAVKKSTDPTPAILKRYAYAYDPAGNRTAEQIDDAVTGASYDTMNRIVTQHPSGTLRLEGTVSEPAMVTVGGKPLDVSSANRFAGAMPIGTGTTFFTIMATDPSGNAASQGFEVDSAGSGKTFTFDANGNMTSDGTRTFEWDARNQLVAINVATHRSEFTYDGEQRRVRVTEKEAGATQSDVAVLWCQEHICEDRSSDGLSVLRRSLTGGEQNGAQMQFFANDHLDSVYDVSNSFGGRLARYDFDPWGRRTLSSGADITNIGFTGHLLHGPSALSLTFYRGYDVSLGRWLSPDPLGDVDGPNIYQYVGNDPVRRMDPLGLQQLLSGAFAGQKKQTDRGIQAAWATCLKKGDRRVYWKSSIGINPLVQQEEWKKWRADFIEGCLKNPSPGFWRYSTCGVGAGYSTGSAGGQGFGFCVCCECTPK